MARTQRHRTAKTSQASERGYLGTAPGGSGERDPPELAGRRGGARHGSTGDSGTCPWPGLAWPPRGGDHADRGPLQLGPRVRLTLLRIPWAGPARARHLLLRLRFPFLPRPASSRRFPCLERRQSRAIGRLRLKRPRRWRSRAVGWASSGLPVALFTGGRGQAGQELRLVGSLLQGEPWGTGNYSNLVKRTY